MQKFLEIIRTRRSIRRYQDKPLNMSVVDKILEAGLYAPSTKNTQDRKIIVIEGKENLKSMEQLVIKATVNAEPHQQEYLPKVTGDGYTLCFNAPLFAICTANSTKGNPESDCAVMLENMFLAAHAMEIGSVWINQVKPLSNVPEFRSFLTSVGVPQDHQVYGAAGFGYALDDTPSQEIPRKDGQIIKVKRIL